MSESLGADRSFPIFVRHTAVSGMAGVLTGLIVGGIGGRIVMFISAVAAGDSARGVLTENGDPVGEFTWEGTFELIIFIGGGFGALGAVVWTAAEPWLRRTGRWCGLTFSALLLALGGTEILHSDSRDFALLEPVWLNVSMFVGLFVLFGPAFVVVRRFLHEILPGHSSMSRTAALEYGLLIVPGVPLVLIMFVSLLTSDFCEGDCGPSVLPAGIAFSAMAITTVMVYGSTSGGAIAQSRRIQWLGSILLVVTILIGSVIVGREIVEILTR